MLAKIANGMPSAVSPDVRAEQFELSDIEIRERISGKICRCGAYIGILEAIKKVSNAEDMYKWYQGLQT